MDRREFLRRSALIAAGTAAQGVVSAKTEVQDAASAEGTAGQDPLISSAPMLQNYAETSIGVAFSVSDMANGYVVYGTQSDLSDGVRVKCGGFRVTDMNDQVMQIRLTGLKPATRYYYKIGADRIAYKHGYDMKITGSEEDPRIYSFTTAGRGAASHFCVINDTHARFETFDLLTRKIAELSPSCVVWNGDTVNNSESIENLKGTILTPPITLKDYASEIPYLFSCGNHDSRGMASRHYERVWMFRQPEERLSRDWDLGRNFAVRMGDIAMIGLDTAEDKQDTNPIFAGLFSSEDYRIAQTAWLKDALRQPEIARAPYLVAFCHIPLFDPDPTANPGDIKPDDHDPRYSDDYAYWQRACAEMWGPLLSKAGCQIVITAHQHRYRYDEPEGSRKWAQMVGGGPKLTEDARFPTVIDGKVEDGRLVITAYNMTTGEIKEARSFSPRRKRASSRRKA